MFNFSIQTAQLKQIMKFNRGNHKAFFFFFILCRVLEKFVLPVLCYKMMQQNKKLLTLMFIK